MQSEVQRGLSVLIPVYQVDVKTLVTTLVAQLEQAGISFEIRAYDDCSPKGQMNPDDLTAVSEKVVAQVMERNLGRSGIRNKLASDAQYSHLLFIDADSLLPDETFIEHYLIYWEDFDALIGGTIYASECPSTEVILRWKYGKHREAITADLRNRAKHAALTLNNLLIRKSVFMSIKLDEAIKGYGHEDTKLGFALAEAKATVHHIQNPVIHIGLEDNKVYLNKVKESVTNFFRLSQIENGCRETNLYSTYLKFKGTVVEQIVLLLFSVFGWLIKTNLESRWPLLFLLDLYKLNLMFRLSRGSIRG